MNADDKIADGRDQALDGSQRGQQQETAEIALGWREIVDALVVGFEFGNDHEHERAHPQRQGGEQRCHAGTIGGDRVDGPFADNSGGEHEVGDCGGIQFAVGADQGTE